MSSQNGMNSTGRLSGSEVCDIIEACQASQVAEIQCGELHVIFARDAYTRKIPVSTDGVTSDDVENIQQRESENANIHSDLSEREDDLEELILTNPEKYEELVEKGELEDVDGASDTEEEG